MQVIEFFQEIGFPGLFDIAFVALLIYTVLVWFKQTRAVFVLTGLVIIGAIYLFARQFNMVLTTAVLQGFFAVILLAVIVIFQEEIRHFFEQVAMWSLNRNLGLKRSIRSPREEVETLVRTATDLAQEKIGALIIIRGKDPIMRHLSHGVDLNGELSEPLLKSLFDPNSIGHDGAVVIEKNHIIEFSSHLPLSKNFKKLHRSGTRHAAALGLAELTDALCLVISEESGVISVARNGDIQTVEPTEELSVVLERFYQEISPRALIRPWQDFLERNSREKVIALIISIVLWFVMVHEARLVQRRYVVPIEYTALEENLLLADMKPKQVEVVFSGPRRAFYFLNDEKISIMLKMFGLEEGTRALTISDSDVSYPQDISLEYLEPRRVTVRILEVGPTK